MFIFVALIGITYGAAPSCFEREECATVSLSGQYGWSCLSYDSCYQTIMTDTVIVNCYGYEGCEEAQITTKYNDDAYTNCDGIKACQNAIISSAIVYVRIFGSIWCTNQSYQFVWNRS